MSYAERMALKRLVDSVTKQLPKATAQDGDDQQIEAEHGQQVAARGANAESAVSR